MKLSFARNGSTVVQTAVAPEQTVSRAARPRYLPIGRIAIALIIVGASAYGLWLFLDRSRIHSYGVVATGVELFHAPIRSRVVAVHAEPGDRVTADSVLCVLVSDDAQTELKEAQEALGQQRGILETVLGQNQASFDDPAQELRDLEAARARLQDAERRAAQGERARIATVARQRPELARRERALAFRSAAMAEHGQRLDQLRTLLQAGATVPAEVDAAAVAERHARFEADEARADLAATLAQFEAEAMRERDEGASQVAAVVEGRAYVERIEALYRRERDQLDKGRLRGIENFRSRIAGLEARVANLRRLAGPTEVRALADGVVTEVFVTDGSNVPKDSPLMSVSGTGKLWINAFVPPERVRDLHPNAQVMVYPTTGATGMSGRITTGGSIQYKVHPALLDRIRDASAVYVRIDLDQPKPDLIPGNVVRVVIR